MLVDELDRGWDASEEAKAFVAGFFQACMSINGLSDNLRVYISLRQELYDNIPALYEDAQKFRDVIEVISWAKPKLLELIAARISYALGEVEHYSDQQCWDKVFARNSPDLHMSSFDSMVDRTLHRPREIIQFLPRRWKRHSSAKPSFPSIVPLLPASNPLTRKSARRILPLSIGFSILACSVSSRLFVAMIPTLSMAILRCYVLRL